MEKGLGMDDGFLCKSALESREGERSKPEGDGRALRSVEPEVLERPERRKYSVEYKLKILKEANGCTQPGQIGALLRREGLFSSNLTAWRRQRDKGVFAGLSPRKRGRKPNMVDSRDLRIRELERENERIKKRLKNAEIIIEFQKKVSEILGIPLGEHEEKI